MTTATRPAFTTEIEWHRDDQAFAAVLIRDGRPWFLDGALVGMGGTRAEAVTDLTGCARHLVIHGSNFLGQISAGDRRWLFTVLGEGFAPPDGELRCAGDTLPAVTP